VRKLKSKSRLPVVIDFDHDCFRVLFSGKGKKSRDGKYMLMGKNDFDDCNWDCDWDTIFNKNLEGSKILFPMKLRIYLGKSPKLYKRGSDGLAQETKRMYIEK